MPLSSRPPRLPSALLMGRLELLNLSERPFLVAGSGMAGDRVPVRAPTRLHRRAQRLHVAKEVGARHGIEAEHLDDLPHDRRKVFVRSVMGVQADALFVHDVFGDDLGEAFTKARAELILKRSDARLRACLLCRRMRMRKQVHAFVQRVLEPRRGRGGPAAGIM